VIKEKFLVIKWKELLFYLLLGTFLSQIIRFLLLEMNSFMPNIITEFRIGKTNFSLTIYCVSASLATMFILFLLKRKGISIKDVGYQGKITIEMIAHSIFGVIVGVFLYSIIDLLSKSLGFGMYWGDISKSYSVIPGSIIDIVLLVLSTVVLAPLAEDTVFRGVLLNFLNNRFTKIKSVVIAAILFAVIHIPFYGPGLTIYMFFWTLISCMLFQKYQSIYPCFIFHSINNLLAYIIFPSVFSNV